MTKSHTAFASDRPQPHASYLEALKFLDEYRPEVSESESLSTPVERPRAHAQSLWVIGDLLDHLSSAPTELGNMCFQALDELRHFNVRAVEVGRRLVHCDFQSLPLPDVELAFGKIRAAKELWAAALESDVKVDQLADIAYADVDYPPRPRKYSGPKVRIDPHATRVARHYSDEDAEVWGP